jgi:hypothetical protein
MSLYSNWKVEEFDTDRWNYLTMKIDYLCKSKGESSKLTREEVVEFLSLWEKHTYSKEDPWVTAVMNGLNKGSNDILFK